MSETKTKRVSLGFHLESKMWVGLDFSKNMDGKSWTQKLNIETSIKLKKFRNEI